MSKTTIANLESRIDAYKTLTEAGSITPTIDGNIKKDILDTLNNKASNSIFKKLVGVPNSDLPTEGGLTDGDYFIQDLNPCKLFIVESGEWIETAKSNDMPFYYKDDAGNNYFYSFSDNLDAFVLVFLLLNETHVNSFPVTVEMQDIDYSVVISHMSGKPNLMISLEDSNGIIQNGILIQNIYDEGVCHQTKILFSDTITRTYKLNIL